MPTPWYHLPHFFTCMSHCTKLAILLLMDMWLVVIFFFGQPKQCSSSYSCQFLYTWASTCIARNGITFRTQTGGQSKRPSTNGAGLLALPAMAQLCLMAASCNLQWGTSVKLLGSQEHHSSQSSLLAKAAPATLSHHRNSQPFSAAAPKTDPAPHGLVYRSPLAPEQAPS